MCHQGLKWRTSSLRSLTMGRFSGCTGGSPFTSSASGASTKLLYTEGYELQTGNLLYDLWFVDGIEFQWG